MRFYRRARGDTSRRSERSVEFRERDLKDEEEEEEIYELIHPQKEVTYLDVRGNR